MEETAANRGPLITDLKVYVNNADITSLINKITILESIGRANLNGWLEVVDSAAFLDNEILGNNRVVISYKYLGKEILLGSYIDGVEYVDLNNINNEKLYRINLKSSNEVINASSTASKAYNGNSTEVIKQIFEEFFTGELNIESEGKNSGKYIAPQISPFAAIAKILFKSYDTNDSPLFLFESLMAHWHEEPYYTTNLISWDDMLEQDPVADIYSVNVPTDTHVGASLPGMPKKVVVATDNGNYIQRIQQGVEGHTIRTVDVNSSSHSTSEFDIHQAYYDNKENVIPNFRHALGLFGAIEKTIMNFDFDDEKMLLGTTEEDNLCLAKCKSIRSKASSTVINAYECNAIPGLISGQTINFNVPIGGKQAGSVDILSSKYAGKYVVSGISHIIDCADMNYIQNIQFMRDGLPVSETEAK